MKQIKCFFKCVIFVFLISFFLSISSMVDDFSSKKNHIFLPKVIKNSINHIYSIELENNDFRLNPHVATGMPYDALLDLILQTIYILQKNEKKMSTKQFNLFNNLLNGYYHLLISETSLKSLAPRVIINY